MFLSVRVARGLHSLSENTRSWRRRKGRGILIKTICHLSSIKVQKFSEKEKMSILFFFSHLPSGSRGKRGAPATISGLRVKRGERKHRRYCHGGRQARLPPPPPPPVSHAHTSPLLPPALPLWKGLLRPEPDPRRAKGPPRGSGAMGRGAPGAGGVGWGGFAPPLPVALSPACSGGRRGGIARWGALNIFAPILSLPGVCGRGASRHRVPGR